MNSRVALGGQQSLDFSLGEILRDGHRKSQQQFRIAVIARQRAQVLLDAGGGVAPHRFAAAPAVQNRGAGEQQFQMIVEFRHGADGGARGAHRVGLVDGDRRRDAFDALHLRLVHAIQELARVGRKGFDVAALALGIQRVEHQRGLSGSADAGNDDQLVEGQVQIKIFEIVLAGTADADGIRAGRIEGWHPVSLQDVSSPAWRR